MAEHHHHHDIEDQGEGTLGMALGFKIIDDGGQLFLAEAEISPYVDSPEELGVTLVFHPLAGINPVQPSDEDDWPAYPVDIDEDLTRSTAAPIPDQFQAIMRQLQGLSDQQLRDYLRVAREESAE